MAEEPPPVASHCVQREVFTSEKVESNLRKVPESFLDQLEFDDMNGIHQYNLAPNQSLDQFGPPQASSTSYSYSYENTYETPNDENGVRNGHITEEGLAQEMHNLNLERQSKQMQKVTKVTKVTSTRQVQQLPAHSPDSTSTRPVQQLPAHSPDSTSSANIMLHQNSSYPNVSFPPSTDGHNSPSDAQINSYSTYSDYVSQYALASAPGAPQAVDIDCTCVTMVWLRPDSDGDVGQLEGYQVHYRQGVFADWLPAHHNLIVDTQCTISNLEANGEYQFRVVAKNSAGFGQPSNASSAVQLRPNFGTQDGSDKHKDKPAVPYPPGRPSVVSMDGSSCNILWDPPISGGTGGPVAGYIVEYRPSQDNNCDWIVANNYIVNDNRYTVHGLRPNGEYEFRVLAKNAEGLSEAGQSTGPVRVRPMAPPRSPNTFIPPNTSDSVSPPSQPQVMDADSDSVTLMWAPPNTPIGAPQPRLLGYIVESREIGVIDWFSASHRLITSNTLTIAGLTPHSTYEFRVFAKTVEGLSEPSEVSELVQLRPKVQGPPRGVPARPHPPEIMDKFEDQVTMCWLPAHSTLPVQGYDIEFRDKMQDPAWYKVNDLLMTECKMSIGELLYGHRYEFRVIGKNAMGYSQPSLPSEPVTVGMENGSSPPRGDTTDGRIPIQQTSFPLQRDMSYNSDMPLQAELVRESPPLPDRDDSPPPIHRPPFSAQDGVHWRDPTLGEVLDYLASPNNVIRLNAAGYLQHLIFRDNDSKKRVRELGGIPKLVDLLSSDIPEIQKNACGCLRNLSYGKENDDNKRSIRECGGITALTNLLRKTPDMQVKEEITGVLWNLSSYHALKPMIFERSADTLVREVLVPGSGWSPGGALADPQRAYNPNVFRNATGTVRNISATGEASRKHLREMSNLVEALTYYLHTAVMTREEYDTKTVDNVVCVLRNLSYRLQEIEDAEYDRHPPTWSREKDPRSRSAPSGSPKVKSKKDSKLFGSKKKGADKDKPSPTLTHPQTTQGVALLWTPDTVKCYLRLLSESNNPETLEAATGAIQNLAACYWQPSIDIRSIVRKDRGLPPLVELLRMQHDRIVCAAATALRNLALDQRNRDLIGKHAMVDLVNKLPVPASDRDRSVSDATLTAVLACIYELILRSAEFTRALHELDATTRIMHLARAKQMFAPRVVKYAGQVLQTMWNHKELQEQFKRGGLKESDFGARMILRPGEAMTLARPISTQGQDRVNPTMLRPDLDPSAPPPTRYGAMGSTNSVEGSARSEPMQRTNGRGHYSNNIRNAHTPEPLYAQVHKPGSRDTVIPRNGLPRDAGDTWV